MRSGYDAIDLDPSWAASNTMHYIPSAVNGLSGQITARHSIIQLLQMCIYQGIANSWANPKPNNSGKICTSLCCCWEKLLPRSDIESPLEGAIVFPDVECCNAIDVMQPVKRS